MSDHFFEVSGVLGPHIAFGQTGRPIHREKGRVVLSNLSRGKGPSFSHPCAGLKFVASGIEVYRYEGRAYSVGPGHFLYVPELQPGDVEIGRSDASGALGLCVYLPVAGRPEPRGKLDLPMLFPASCSKLGRLLSGSVRQMTRSPKRSQIAESLLQQVAQDLEPLLEETSRIIDGVDALKVSTRYETVRRLNVARGYLHEVTDRPVELAELARVAGISRFQLLRSFRDAFGAPPGAYHRNLRLRLAKSEIERNLASCSQAAERYGFADGSSFSHAYRRVFGEAPVRSLAASR